MNAAIIFAGGTGQRMKNTAKPKQFLELYGKPIIIYTLEVFEKHPDIDMIIVPCVKGWEDYYRRQYIAGIEIDCFACIEGILRRR